MLSPSTYYEQNITRYTASLKKLQNNIAIVALFRLLSFAATGITLYYWLHDGKLIPMVLTLVFLAFFILFVSISLRFKDTKRLLEKLLFINNNENNILQNLPNQFPDGKQFSSNEDYSADLDIFGGGSLFQLLNRTTTSHGTQKLTATLKQPYLLKNEIEENQDAIRTLAPQTEKRQMLTACGLLYEEKEGTLDDLSKWLQTPLKFQEMQWLNIARFLIPAYNIGTLLYFLDTNNYLPMMIGIIINWSILGSLQKYIKKQHELLGKKQAILDQYAAILQVAATIEAGNSTVLQQLKTDAGNACKAIKRLSVLSRYFDQRSNLLVILFFNSLGLYDIHCMWALEGWKKIHRKNFSSWIICVGKIESLNSFATFAFNNPEYTYPNAKESTTFIQAKGLSHPLIPAKECVANDFELGGGNKLVLVTGSNMSGKTTFLRTLGINLLLAQCGTPVNATEFSFSPMLIATSIRVSDSLQEHTSYFMAELKRLQQIIRQLQQNKIPTLVLIDEILRGTNSDDKTHGSDQFIRKLLQYNCLTLFATHDLTLSKLENEFPQTISNYCFESTIENGELIFDYTLRKGVAKNKNASFLMKKMEII